MSAVEGLIEKGIVTEGSTVEELAGKIEAPADTLKNTVDRWNTLVAIGVDEDFQRDTGNEDLLKQLGIPFNLHTNP